MAYWLEPLACCAESTGSNLNSGGYYVWTSSWASPSLRIAQRHWCYELWKECNIKIQFHIVLYFIIKPFTTVGILAAYLLCSRISQHSTHVNRVLRTVFILRELTFLVFLCRPKFEKNSNQANLGLAWNSETFTTSGNTSFVLPELRFHYLISQIAIWYISNATALAKKKDPESYFQNAMISMH